MPQAARDAFYSTVIIISFSLAAPASPAKNHFDIWRRANNTAR